jgi:hypothetical protein
VWNHLEDVAALGVTGAHEPVQDMVKPRPASAAVVTMPATTTAAAAAAAAIHSLTTAFNNPPATVVTIATANLLGAATTGVAVAPCVLLLKVCPMFLTSERHDQVHHTLGSGHHHVDHET